MPRFDMDRRQALDIATYLVPSPSLEAGPPARPEDLAAGRRLLEAKGCGTCHLFGGIPALRASAIPVTLTPERMEQALVLAPDLRFTRDRFQAGQLVAWLQNPRAVDPGAAMPTIPMSAREAEQMAAFILHVELAAATRPEVPARLPALDRPVTYAEVHERVFRRTCRHCHADPDLALGDGGPGNTGGFGFAPRRLNLATYVGVASGYLADDGRRRSLFEPNAEGVPRLIEVLLARHAETVGEPVDGVRGMPLGLPPVPLEDIQLLDTWIAQGRPQ